MLMATTDTACQPCSASQKTAVQALAAPPPPAPQVQPAMSQPPPPRASSIPQPGPPPPPQGSDQPPWEGNEPTVEELILERLEELVELHKREISLLERMVGAAGPAQPVSTAQVQKPGNQP